MDDLIKKGNVAWSGSSWSVISVAPAGTSTGGDNAHGFWQPVSGRFIGKGATEGDNKQSPTEGVFAFSAAGFRSYDDGRIRDVGYYGYWRSSSSNGTSTAWVGEVDSGRAQRTNGTRQFGSSVRCVKE